MMNDYSIFDSESSDCLSGNEINSIIVNVALDRLGKQDRALAEY